MVDQDKPICLGNNCSFNGQMLLQICETLATNPCVDSFSIFCRGTSPVTGK